MDSKRSDNTKETFKPSFRNLASVGRDYASPPRASDAVAIPSFDVITNIFKFQDDVV